MGIGGGSAVYLAVRANMGRNKMPQVKNVMAASLPVWHHHEKVLEELGFLNIQAIKACSRSRHGGPWKLVANPRPDEI